jgi:hemoglobin-like flavoprotein
VSPDAVAVARSSYERCLAAAAEFFPAFYRNFFRHCPPAEPLFARTDFPRQHKLLRHAIGLLFTYASHPDSGPAVLQRVAERHAPGQLAIPAEHYGPFVDALVETAGQFDPSFTPAIEAAWRAAVAPGIDYMKSMARA